MSNCYSAYNTLKAIDPNGIVYSHRDAKDIPVDAVLIATTPHSKVYKVTSDHYYVVDTVGKE